MSLFISSFRILTASSLRFQSDSEILRLSEACSSSHDQLMVHVHRKVCHSAYTI